MMTDVVASIVKSSFNCEMKSFIVVVGAGRGHKLESLPYLIVTQFVAMIVALKAANMKFVCVFFDCI